MFNVHQREWMKYLDSLPLEKRCYCGWNRVGECPNDECQSGRNRVEGRRDYAIRMHERNKFHNRTADSIDECMDELCVAVRTEA